MVDYMFSVGGRTQLMLCYAMAVEDPLALSCNRKAIPCPLWCLTHAIRDVGIQRLTDGVMFFSGLLAPPFSLIKGGHHPASVPLTLQESPQHICHFEHHAS